MALYFFISLILALIMNTSSLVMPRIKEVAMLIDPDVKKWIVDNDVHLYSFDEL